ncbi:MAG TPA: hypothetical protein VFE17_07530 [Candidatus Baltobacteraceae bacterium]|jgi:hypothetical protein|nr:hypothetical protein [Candidatus Baltobacteraceae bacterium]
MRNAYKLIAGNSVVTPIGIAIAIILAMTLRGLLGQWVGAVYVAVLLCTLVAATMEPVQ